MTGLGNGLNGGTPPKQAGREIEFIYARDMRPQLQSTALVKGVIEREQISLLFGPPGTGKTFLAIDRDMSIATGISWFGHKVKPGPVVYLAIEAGRRAIQNRCYAWLQAHGMEGQDVPFVAVTSPVDLCHLQAGHVPLLLSTIRERMVGFSEPALLEIDTVSRALAGGDENAPTDMGAFLFTLDQLRSALRCHISGIHHTGKTDSINPRGHGLLQAAADTWLQIQRPHNSAICSWMITRQRDGIAGAKFHFKLPQVVLGNDEDGDPVTTCLVKATEAPITDTADGEDKLRPREQIALNQLAEAINTAGIVPPNTSHIPRDKACVTLDLWRRYCSAGGLAHDATPDAQRIAISRATERLMARRRVGNWQNMVWLP
jgi:hypothetical protein